MVEHNQELSVLKLILEGILRSIPDAVFFADNQGITRWANDKGADLLKKAKCEIMDQEICRFLSVEGHLNQAMKAYGPIDFEQELNRTIYQVTVTPIWQSKDFCIGVIIRYWENTEEKVLKETIKEKEKLYQELDEIIEACSDGVYVTDGDGVTLRINSACQRITGLEREKVLGKNMRQIVEAGWLSASCTLKVIETKKRTTILQNVPNGRQVIVTGEPLFDKSGQIYRVVSNTRDITELNNLKNKIQKERQLTDQYYSELVSLKLKQMDDPSITVHSEKMHKVVELAMRVARTDSTLMIGGESGVGKEVIARLIHNEGNRKNYAFMKINCAAIPENLLESELFGYEAGAFSGAKKEGKAGLIELANSGTLFLDEIGELPLALQAKLLQVIQERRFMRVGGTRSIEVSIRIITASNRNLMELVKEGRFREDLYYRLNVIPINIPPLRERIDDIPPLIHRFLTKFNRQHSMNKLISNETVDVLVNYPWPGNVRELENLMERLVVITLGNIILPEDLPGYIYIKGQKMRERVAVSGLIPLHQALEEVERQLFLRAFDQYRSTYKVAVVLQVSQPTVVRKLKKYKNDLNDLNDTVLN